MDFARSLRSWALVFVAAGLTAMGWISAALAQTADSDAADSDEFSLALLMGVIDIAAVGWFVYRGRSPRSR